MKQLLKSSSTLVLCGLIAAGLAGCHDESPTDTTSSKIVQADSSRIPLEKIFAEHDSTEIDKKLKDGVEKLLEGDYHGASKQFNTALVDNPSSTWIHYLNGLSYHLMARNGDVTQNDLAAAGFEQSLKYDPANILASLQLGRVRADQKRYIDAQEEFANVLLLQPNNFEAVYELAAVSYKMGDIKTARVAIDRAEKQHGSKPEVVKAKAMILAASGQGEAALMALANYRKNAKNPYKAQRLEGRLQSWNSLYNSGLILAQYDDSAAPDDQLATDAAAPDSTVGAADPAAEDVAIADAVPSEMIILDAVVMRVDDVGETSKGNNILDNFTLAIAPGTHYKGKSNSGNTSFENFPVFNSTTPLIGSTPSIGGDHAAGGTSGRTNVFTQGISFGTITYSMKIANAERQHIEVVGRPSLVASVGKPAKFFSGRELALGLSGEYGGTITKLPVGVTLDVTPTSFDGETVILDVTLYGSVIANEELVNKDATKNFTNIGISKVQTTIKAKLGETIMLAGITERIDEDGKSGFPILQDIPVVQYAFSRETTLASRKSVMYLITPRAYDDNKNMIKSITDFKDKRVNLKELELRNKDWYSPDYNMAITLKHLAPLYREFRQGDIDEIDWHMRDNVKTQAEQAVSFFYY